MPDIKLGTVDRSVPVFIPDPASTDGSGKTGLVAANLTVSYTRVETDNDVVVTDVTSSLSNLSALTDAHADWGLKEVSSTLAPGLYRLDIADAVFASGAWYAVVYVMITSSAAAASPILFTLIAFDPLDAVRLGLTALPNASADAAGGLPISDAGGLDVDAQRADVVAILVDTGTTLQGEVDGIQADTEDIQARLPAALVSGRIDSSVGAMAANVMTAAAAASDLTTELQSGLATAAALGVVDGIVDDILVDTAEIGVAGTGLTNINLPNQTMDIVGNLTGNLSGSVGSVTAGVTLAASAVQAIWDALTSALTTVGSIGKLLVDNLNATISSRLASASYTTPPTAGAIADQVWEEAIADHSGTVGSVAEALAAAGSAGDPWVTALPGGYGAGSAGKILGDNLNATVSSRATPAQVNTEADTALVDAGVTTTRTGYLDNLSAGAVALQGSVQYIFDALRSYFQLLVRKDAAIATDAAPGLADLNNDEGSGAGAYDNTTDSVEALRDRVDDVPTGSELATALAAGVNVTEINGTTLIGDGQIATPWGPA